MTERVCQSEKTNSGSVKYFFSFTKGYRKLSIKKAVFSIVSKNYLNFARTLMASLHKNPQWRCVPQRIRQTEKLGSRLPKFDEIP
jgi:hypothetical protein